jgi:uncharacterized membrane protein
VAPKTIPRHLHWFKYEAYFTWVSGIALLFIVYYFNASAMLIDHTVLKLSSPQAIGISIASFIIAWFLYDLLCKSPLRKRPVLYGITGIVLLIGFAWFYANVFFVIIPAQKAMVHAARKGLVPDGSKGKNALFRSIHNNYFTLPVLFVMVSNHFPSTFGNKYQWIVLSAITLGSAGIKHWLNLREQGRLNVWILPVSVILLLGVAYITAPQPSQVKCKDVSMAMVNEIVQKRCVQCHSSRPTDDVYTAPPNGVKYDTPEEIAIKKELIMQRVVITKTMPQNNKTNMTPDERDLIRCWIEQGARLK